MGNAIVCSSTTLTKPGSPPLYEHCRLTLLVGRGKEEHVHALDELAVGWAKRVDDQPLFDAVGESTGVELVLQRAAAGVEEIGHGCAIRWPPIVHTLGGAHHVACDRLERGDGERRPNIGLVLA